MNLNREVFLDGFLITETHAHICRRQIMVHGVQVRHNGTRVMWASLKGSAKLMRLLTQGSNLEKKLTTDILIVLKCIFTFNSTTSLG